MEVRMAEVLTGISVYDDFLGNHLSPKVPKLQTGRRRRIKTQTQVGLCIVPLWGQSSGGVLGSRVLLAF